MRLIDTPIQLAPLGAPWMDKAGMKVEPTRLAEAHANRQSSGRRERESVLNFSHGSLAVAPENPHYAIIKSPRLEVHGLGAVANHPYAAPYEELKLKGR